VTSNSAASAPPARPDEWFTPKRFAWLLGLLICATYPDVVIGSGTFFHRDFALFGYPLAAHHRECFWRGELPLWTPLSYCGLPFLAQWNTMTLYPLSLFYLLLPLSWSLGVFCLGHLFLGGLGMYFLAHRWTQNRLAASVAGLAFAFNAVLLHSLMWPNNMAGFGWMPWVVLAVERAWREGGRRIILAALAGTMQMLSGAPEVILLTWLFLGALWVADRSAEFIPPQRGNAAGSRVKSALRFLLVVALIIGLTAAQMLPFLDLLRASQRHEGFSDSTWAMPVWGWANFLVPLFRARSTALGIYVQPEQFWIQSYYLGIGVVWLAALAVWKVRSPRVWLLALVTLACLLVALGDKGLVYAALRRVLPGLGFMRFPIKFIILPTFLVPLLAAFFVAHCRSQSAEMWLRTRRKLIPAAAAFLLVIGFVGFAALQFPMQGVAAKVGMRSAVTSGLILVLFVVALIALQRGGAGRFARLPCFALAGLVWIDAIASGPRPNPTAPRWVYEPGLAARESGMNPLPRVGEGRPMLSAEAEGNANVVQLTNAADTVVYSRLAMFGNVNLLDDVPKVIGSYSLFFRELSDVFTVLYSTPEPPSGLLDFFSVSQVNAPGKITQWMFRPTHQPWVTGGQKPVFADAPATLRALGSREFKPRQEVYLPAESRGLVTVNNASSPIITTREFSSHRMRIEAEAAETALIVMAQSFYHNWRAYVDGQPTTLLRANHAFQALEIPAGKHQVVLKYEDRMFRLGLVISGLATAVCVALGWRGKRQA
jgi:hypothetical protein